MSFFRKYPCTMQHDASDCGAAVMSTILLVYKSEMSIMKLREIIGTDAYGTSVKGIVDGFEKLHFNVRAIRTTTKEITKEITLPAIAHVKTKEGLNHFIVIHKIIRGNQILVADPSEGLKKMKLEEFEQSFTGVLVLMIPNSEFERLSYKNKGEYSSSINLVTINIILAMILAGAFGYFFLQIEVFGEVTFSIGSFLFTFLVVYILSVFLHEIGHFVMAKRYGYRFRIFKAGGILAFNHSFRNLSLKPLQLLSGGFVLLNFNEAITSRKKLDHFIIHDFRYISLGGMFANVLLVVVGILFMFDSSTFTFGYIFSFLNFLVIITQFIHPSDLTKYWFIKKNPQNAAIVFTEELAINWKINSFLEELFHSYIDESLSSKKVDQFLLAIIQRVIEYNLLHHQENSQEMNRFIIWFRDNFETFNSMGIGMRLTAERFMHVLAEYNLVEQKDLPKRKLSPVIHKHPLDSYYLHFSGYRRKLVELETRRKESGNNGLRV